MTAAASTLEERASPGAGPDLLQLERWADRHGLVAGVTTRAAGDFGLHATAPAGEVIGRWLDLPRRLGPGFDGLVVARQVHGSEIATHRRGSGWRVLDGVDGHCTADPGLLLAISVADCVPVYLAAPDAGVLALVHAGWRGVAAGILEAAIDRLGPRPGNVTVHFGVAICGPCYEVGPEVVAALGLPPASGPVRLDLRQVLADRAARCGVGEVTRSPWCARHDPAFHSHRRDGRDAGRMAAFLGRPSA